MADENAEKPRRRKFGCMLITLLVGAALLAGGVRMLGSWDAMDAGGKAGAIILVVLGSLVILPIVVVFVAVTALKVFFGRMRRDWEKAIEGMQAAGADITKMSQGLYSRIHSFREAADDDFEAVDRSYYERTTQELTQQGYRHLGDIVDETVEELGSTTTPIRVLTSADGTTQVGLYHLVTDGAAQAAAGRPLLMCDVSTEFSDGTFLGTSNTQGLDVFAGPAAIVKQQYPLETPLAQLLVEHGLRRAKLLEEKPGVTCRAIQTIQEAIDSEQRQEAIKNAFRKQMGYIAPEEVQAIARQSGDEDVEIVGNLAANAVAKAKEEMKNQEGGAQG